MKEDFTKIVQTERGISFFMALNFLAALALAVVAFVNLNPNLSAAKIGYSDLSGYRDGSWVDMFAFPLLALVFGVLHAFLALKIFHKRGSGMAKFFLVTTTFLLFCAFLVLIRILGEI